MNAEEIIGMMKRVISDNGQWTTAMFTILTDPSYRPGFNFLGDRHEESDVPDTEFARGAASFLIEHKQLMGSYGWAERFQVTKPLTV